MLSFLKTVWDSLNPERKILISKELFEKECNYFDERIEAEERQDPTKPQNGNDSIKNSIKETECSKQSGTITFLGSNHGFIDKTIFFDMDVCKNIFNTIQIGSRVDYMSYRNPRTGHITVIKIDGLLDECWDQISDTKVESRDTFDDSTPEYFTTGQRNILGMVIEVKSEILMIETEYKTLKVDMKAVKCEFSPKEGDRVYVCCKVQNDEGYVDRFGEILEILSIIPARTLSDEKCTVTALYDGWAILNNDCYVTFDILPESSDAIIIGNLFKAEMIECDRGKFNWRCIRLSIFKESEPSALNGSQKSNANEYHPITIDTNLMCIFGALDRKQPFNVTISNNSLRPMKATGVKIFVPYRLGSLISLANPNDADGFEIPSKESYELIFNIESKFYGESRETFELNFRTFHIKRSIAIITCVSEAEAEDLRLKKLNNLNTNIKPLVNTARNNRSRFYANSVWSKESNVIPGIRSGLRRRFMARHIPTYEVPIRLRDAYLTNERKESIIDQIEGLYPCLISELSIENYVQRFQTLIFLEEIEYFVNFRKYDRERAHFKHEGEYLSLTIENLSERRPSLVIGDSLRAINPFVEDPKSYEGFIHKVLFERILLKFDSSFHGNYRNEDCRLEFFYSRFGFRKLHYATERIVKHLGEKFLFPARIRVRDQPQLNIELDDDLNMHLDGKKLQWFNSKLNSFQKRAVFNVLRGETENMAYVIFGPPGTGKTVTIVEAILQLLRNVKSARILVGTPSNAGANLIASRLIESKEVLPGDFVRLVSHNLIAQDLIPSHLAEYCATVDMGLDGSCKNEMTITESGLKLRCQMKYLGQHRLTIGTCSTLGNYLQMNFPADHFSHVLLDEAGQCTEPEIMIPINQISRTRGQVVLAGDPRQMSAVVTNRFASDRGLSLSFLERILNCSPYHKNNTLYPKSCGYDPRLVTKLLYNYRALPSVLKTYNDFFYDSELIPVINETDSKEYKMLQELIPKLFTDSNERSESHGVYFYGVRSENQQDKDSPSWYNSVEARNVFLWTVRLYRQNILPQNIGIITPYSRQVKYLRNMFYTANVEMPKIGTVEEFQGQERDIILISTVRSSSNFLSHDLKYSLGFMRCPKRMNVAISRARALLIVFGNPHLLCLDSYWCKFIQYCIENHAYEGCDLPEALTVDSNLNELDESIKNAID